VVCGDLTASFRPYNGEKIILPALVKRDEFVEGIHKAKFKNVPSNYKALTKEEINTIKNNAKGSALLPAQEKGVRSACALPYELYADGQLGDDKQSFEIKFKAGNEIFGSGSPFNVYAPGLYKNDSVETWAYTASAGDTLKDKWSLTDFENNKYHLRVYGPNGFFREFAGDTNDAAIEIVCGYERSTLNTKKFTGNIALKIRNKTGKPQIIEITDNAYKTPLQAKSIKDESIIILNLSRTYNWYDFTVRVKGNKSFLKRYAGHVETGAVSQSDPAMGKMI